VPLLDVLERAAELTPDRVTAPAFAAKTNHDCGGVVLCPDRASLDWAGARQKLGQHMARDYWRMQRETAYRGIERKILVEALLPGAPGAPNWAPPDDHKFYCFSGRVQLVQVISGRGGAQTRTHLTPAWEVLPVRRRGLPASTTPPPRPARLGRMVAIAEALAAPFRFCRVDLYAVGERIYFGEYAFYPDGGYRPFEPVEWEEKLGAMVRL
jgi:hypothetical protein